VIEFVPLLGVCLRQTMHTSAPSILQYTSSVAAPCASYTVVHDAVQCLKQALLQL